jgi:hypothetical protein
MQRHRVRNIVEVATQTNTSTVVPSIILPHRWNGSGFVLLFKSRRLSTIQRKTIQWFRHVDAKKGSSSTDQTHLTHEFLYLGLLTYFVIWMQRHDVRTMIEVT